MFSPLYTLFNQFEDKFSQFAQQMLPHCKRVITLEQLSVYTHRVFKIPEEFNTVIKELF